MKQDEPFTIFYKDGWAWLTVYPFNKRRKPVYPEDIQGKLKLLGIPSVRRRQIYTHLETTTGIPKKLTPWPEGKNLGPQINLNISDDAITATISIKEEKPGGEPLSAEMIINSLKEHGIIFGIQENAIKNAVKGQRYNQPIVVAAGIFPIHQKSAKPHYFFETDRGKPFKKLSFDRIDLRELNFIQNKKKDDLLVELIDPVHPIDGKDVYGKNIAADRSYEVSALQAGDGAVVSPDGTEIRALRNGNVKLVGGILIVEPLITVTEIDYSNDNMDFNGAIDIQGRVADGFTVKATGDIQIGKSVSRVHISSGGDMILKAGISGNDEGTLICGGDLYARYIENAIVQCKGNLYVEEALMHSKIKADGDIILAGKRAEIFGGEVLAGGSVVCKKLGNINEPSTILHAGVCINDYSKLLRMEEEVKKYAAEMDELETKIRQLHTALKKTITDQNIVFKIENTLKQLAIQNTEASQAYGRSSRQLHEIKRTITVQKEARVVVEQKIFGKVSIYFGIHKWVSSGKGTLKTILQLKNDDIIEK